MTARRRARVVDVQLYPQLAGCLTACGPASTANRLSIRAPRDEEPGGRLHPDSLRCACAFLFAQMSFERSIQATLASLGITPQAGSASLKKPIRRPISPLSSSIPMKIQIPRDGFSSAVRLTDVVIRFGRPVRKFWVSRQVCHECLHSSIASWDGCCVLIDPRVSDP